MASNMQASILMSDHGPASIHRTPIWGLADTEACRWRCCWCLPSPEFASPTSLATLKSMMFALKRTRRPWTDLRWTSNSQESRYHPMTAGPNGIQLRFSDRRVGVVAACILRLQDIAGPPSRIRCLGTENVRTHFEETASFCRCDKPC